MTRILGVDAKRAAVVALSLVSALACGGAIGCGGGGGGSDSGVDGSEVDAHFGKEAGPGKDTGPADVAPLPQVAKPTFTPAAGMFTAPVSLVIADTTKNSTIFYTLDGTNPNPNSQVYSGPIAITANGDTKVSAYATATGFTDSDVERGTYTIAIPANTVVAPTPTPQTSTSNNDFLASLSTSTAGATICFTLDGSTPVCMDGTCQGGSQTYNAQTQIPINGTETGKGGQVNLNALACKSGMKDGVLPAPGVTYTLQVATPTLQGPTPDPTVHLFNVVPVTAPKGTLSPTVASTTVGATALYTLDANNQPTCSNGMSLTTLPTQIALDETQGNQTIYVVGCKPGYLASTLETGAYTITLNPPSSTPAPTQAFNQIQSVSVNDSANVGAGTDWTCSTTDGKAAPSCGAAQGACTTGKASITFASNTRPAGAGFNDLNVNGTIVEAVACSVQTGKTVFANSTLFESAAYQLQLNPIVFTCTPSTGAPITPCTAVSIPSAGSVTVTANESATPANGEQYDFICSNTDGKATPDCTCNTTTNTHLIRTNGATWTSATIAAASTVANVTAVGCVNSAATAPDPNGALGDNFLPSSTPPAGVAIGAPGQMLPPTIVPAVAQMANPVQIQFTNAGADPAYFCYTVNNTVPTDNATTPATCFAPGSTTGATFCTTASTAANATSTDGPFNPAGTGQNPGPIPTGTWIQAIACDALAAQPLAPSKPATAIQYQLVVGTPSIATKGAVNFGETILVKSATSGAVIHYSISGTVPDCTGSFPTITAGTVADGQGLFDATYYAMGHETGAFEVIGCKPGYTVSAGTDTTTFVYSVATPVVYEQGSSTPLITGQTLNDTISVLIGEPVDGSGAGTDGMWFCSGPNPGCSTVTAGQCTGAGSLPSAVCSIPLTTAANGAQPVTAPPNCFAGGPTLPPAINIVACAPITPASATLKSSGLDSPNFVFANSAIALTSPATNAAAAGVTFAGTLSTTAPDGNAAATPAVSGATGNGAGGFTYMCASSSATIASLGAQPSDCASFVTSLPATWGCCNSATATGTHGATCVVGTPASGVGEPGPTLTLPDQGVSGTYAVFSCKNGLTWSTNSFPVTFAPYVHTPAFVATGTTSDFTAGKENIAGADGATAYVTFDATNLYVGFNYAAVATTDIVHFYIGSKANGTNAADNSFVTDGRTLPNFDALYHVFWKLDNSLAVTSDNWSGTAWVADGNIATVKYNAGSTFVEFTIPLASLALIQAGDIHLLGADWTGAADVGAWPTTNPDTGAWTSWQTEVLTDGFAPNDATRLDLP